MAKPVTEKKKKQKNIFLIAAIGLAFVFIASLGARIYLATKDGELATAREAYVALGFYQFEQPRTLANVNLRNLTGEEKPFVEHLSGWRLVNFGYLSCPDICPINLSLLNHLKTDWDAEENVPNLDVLHVTFDPERDTPDLLQRYLDFMNPNFYGLTGDVSSIKQLGQQLNIVFYLEEPNERGDYFISHSDSMALINPKGQYVGLFKGPYNLEKMTKALKLLLTDPS